MLTYIIIYLSLCVLSRLLPCMSVWSSWFEGVPVQFDVPTCACILHPPNGLMHASHVSLRVQQVVIAPCACMLCIGGV